MDSGSGSGGGGGGSRAYRRDLTVGGEPGWDMSGDAERDVKGSGATTGSAQESIGVQRWRQVVRWAGEEKAL